MVNRIEIERLLQSKELKELWQTIQQELPQLHFCEENDFWEEARIDNLEDLSIKDLYTYLLSDSFRAFCKYVLLEWENEEIVIDESERDYILNELEISEDEYKQRCKTHDYLDVANCLIDYYLLNKHPDILLEYYKMQGYKESEQIFKNKINLYSMCKS